MKPREVPDPVYDEGLLFKLVQTGLSDQPWLSYSKDIYEHGVVPTVANAEGARAALLQHVFAGDCVKHRGNMCKEVVKGEKWAQSVGVKSLDLVMLWHDQGKLEIQDLNRICQVLGLSSSATHQKRSVLSKLVGRRRNLLLALDAAKLTVDETLLKVGSSANLDGMRALCGAHSIEADTRNKEEMVESMFKHLTNGVCAENHGPGCEEVIAEMKLSANEPVHTQIRVLKYIQQRLSRRQLQKVLDLHGIDRKDRDSKKMMKYCLGLYVQKLEKGKLQEVEEQREQVARSQKLEEIRKCWLRMVPPQMKENLIKQF